MFNDSHDYQHGRHRRQKTLLTNQDHLRPRRWFTFASTAFAKPATDRPLFRRKQLLVVFPTSFDKASRERAGHIRSGTQLGSPGYPKRRIGSCFTRLSNKSNHRAMAAHRAEQEREA
jgi:hypothetical protein